MTEYKFKLGEHVFVLGRDGLCIVKGRGKMKFTSGGTASMYMIGGAYYGAFQENELLSIEERKDIAKEFPRG